MNEEERSRFRYMMEEQIKDMPYLIQRILEMAYEEECNEAVIDAQNIIDMR